MWKPGFSPGWTPALTTKTFFPRELRPGKFAIEPRGVHARARDVPGSVGLGGGLVFVRLVPAAAAAAAAAAVAAANFFSRDGYHLDFPPVQGRR
eukprot:31280-Pelagococcus_subviridis.AAC.11